MIQANGNQLLSVKNTVFFFKKYRIHPIPFPDLFDYPFAMRIIAIIFKTSFLFLGGEQNENI